MSDTVISVENLSKSYLIGHDGPQERYHSLRDTLVRHGKNYVRKAIDMARGRQIIQGDSVEEFWALKDVSFEVKRGEVLGIIGRNGAGKSTLLKILSRITEPTSGRVVLDGRVASLLEVGTGFHPELTGRENIFLNGAILGMTKAEIRKKFDEIVDFAGVEKFLDTPVKRYSSGMYVRLAFAVAAHLEPEILIIDEVLAVGDAEFQKKCLGKMQEVAKGGRTVLFVSHNMGAVRALCSQAIILDKGLVVAGGPCITLLETYLAGVRSTAPSSRIQWNDSEKPTNRDFTLACMGLFQDDREAAVLDMTKPIEIRIEILRKQADSNSELSLEIVDSLDNTVLLTSTAFFDSFLKMRGDHCTCSYILPAYSLNSGKYSLNIAADVPNLSIDWRIENVLFWEVQSSCRTMARYAASWPGIIGPRLGSWKANTSDCQVKKSVDHAR
jgi:ABC-type polysaccharide/polyol phosphate transport system ATPase subunit